MGGDLELSDGQRRQTYGVTRQINGLILIPRTETGRFHGKLVFYTMTVGLNMVLPRQVSSLAEDR